MIYSTISFWAAIFILPNQCLLKLKQMCNAFLWKGTPNSARGAKISWEVIFTPKVSGGLRLKRLSSWNNVLALKLIWLLFTAAGSLWVSWVRLHLIGNRSFWTLNPASFGSWVWRKLCKLRPIARPFLVCEVGSGVTAKFWLDNWTGLGPLIDITGPLGPEVTGLPLESVVRDAVRGCVQNDNPWLVVGDFNVTLSSSEHSRSQDYLPDQGAMREFQDTVQSCGLEDLSFVGQIFTWTNSQDESPISARSWIEGCQKAIKQLKSSNGEVLTELSAIKAEAVSYYKEFLQTQPRDIEIPNVNSIANLVSFRCSVGNIATLLQPITTEEIHKTVFSMPLKKAPDPDDFTAEFYRAVWSIIGAYFVVAVQSFFLYGFMPKEVNGTVLSLVPKVTNPETMKDYRPIACCNLLYKVISKILARRSRSAIKLDISKAFDTVQWPFIIATLRAMHFPDQFIYWISQLSNRFIGVHPKCQAVNLSHLSFADYIMVFTDGSPQSLRGILAVFDEFARKSRLNINVMKSSLYAAGRGKLQLQREAERVGLAICELSICYLGLPLTTKALHEGLIGTPGDAVMRHLLSLKTLFGLAVPDSNAGRDMILWRHSIDEYKVSFSTTLTWDIIRTRRDTKEWSGAVWFSQDVPHLTFITWLAVLDRLSTGARSRQWGCLQNYLFCNEPDESRDHLFFACPYSFMVWLGTVGTLLRSDPTPDWNDTLCCVVHLHDRGSRGILLRLVFQVTIYYLWRERNERKHCKVFRTHDQLVHLIDKLIRSCRFAITRKRSFGI
ncbi:Endonuclease/exonuclease/phosphatase superfamily [Arabidopsis thaliana x Arabidopsis arenosa]|uniref:Endonuclease/exonuclease/phosphatase superfamily n=1 Tax=Arabidopsis thaliana x Arabidopsis arenosa TaxID=1240361 RepID=A0A8T2A6T6_9BRAS|nr:Endonuclease/exonuclease/phosphatase superfamily [Arabidopsis thaliana x Arabidopsis arenosa]